MHDNHNDDCWEFDLTEFASDPQTFRNKAQHLAERLKLLYLKKGESPDRTITWLRGYLSELANSGSLPAEVRAVADELSNPKKFSSKRLKKFIYSLHLSPPKKLEIKHMLVLRAVHQVSRFDIEFWLSGPECEYVDLTYSLGGVDEEESEVPQMPNKFLERNPFHYFGYGSEGHRIQITGSVFDVCRVTIEPIGPIEEGKALLDQLGAVRKAGGHLHHGDEFLLVLKGQVRIYLWAKRQISSDSELRFPAHHTLSLNRYGYVHYRSDRYYHLVANPAARESGQRAEIMLVKGL